MLPAGLAVCASVVGGYRLWIISKYYLRGSRGRARNPGPRAEGFEREPGRVRLDNTENGLTRPHTDMLNMTI
jgi:hypothetical protein